MAHTRSACLPVCLAVVALAAPAAAQTMPRGDISGGYQFLNLSSGGEGDSFPKGWYVDVAGNLSESIGVVFELGGNYKSLEESFSAFGVTATAKADLKLHEFMGGVRLASRRSPAVVPFGQVLAGAVNGSASFSGTASVGGLPVFEESGAESGTNFALQFGGGAVIGPSGTIGVRVGVDYVRVFAEDEGANMFRFAAGINIPF